jgi:WD40 repeat protein
VSGSSDKTLRVWDAENGDHPFEGVADDISSVTFSTDGMCLVSGSHNGATRVWDTEDAGSGKLRGDSFEGTGNISTSVVSAPNDKHNIPNSRTDTEIVLPNVSFNSEYDILAHLFPPFRSPVGPSAEAVSSAELAC